MAKKVKKETKKQILKNVQEDIRKRLEVALADFKIELGEKKFEKRLKKVSEIFSDGIILQKEAGPVKKQKRKTKKEIVPEQSIEVTI